MEKARKINTLDYVRVIATLMVFMLHTLIFTSQKVGVDLNEYFRRLFIFKAPAWAGVWIFFILSGYFAGKGFAENKYTLNMRGILRYYILRFIKIGIPTYFFVFLCCTLLYPDFIFSDKYVLLRMMTFTYNGVPGLDGIGATWYVSSLMQMYLIVPGIVFLLEKIKTVMKNNANFFGYFWILLLAVGDEIKEDSKLAINNLKKQGIKKVVMLTGDRKQVGEEVAKKLNIDNVFTELLPTDKVEKLQELLNGKNQGVAFVGDGLNDAPVLAMADVGIAMGGYGTDAAIEAADVVIMTDEPSKICEAIKTARKTIKISKENITFAIGVKILVLLLVFLGIAKMWEAVFADVGVTVLATLNALRTLKK